MITGLNHLTLAVRDLGRSVAFYREVLGFRLVARWPAGAYLLAGDLWVALIVDPRTRTSRLPEYTHAAFSIDAGDFEAMARRITSSGAPTWKENESEGASLYFEDPDGHALELHVGDLASRLASARERPWPGLELPDHPD